MSFSGTGAQNQAAMAEHEVIGSEQNGNPAKKVTSAASSIKITESGNYTYIAKSQPGASQSDSTWQAFRIDETTGMLITWADGNSKYDNIATDLTTLTYV